MNEKILNHEEDKEEPVQEEKNKLDAHIPAYEVFQHFNEEGYAGKLFLYYKKMKEAFNLLQGLFLLVTFVLVIVVLVGKSKYTWDHVGYSFLGLVAVAMLNEIVSFIFQGICIVVKNCEDQILKSYQSVDEESVSN